jgi:hypothetical protein
LRIRKQAYELTLDDLIRFPVWEFALDEEGEEGQDEATVRPFEHDGAVDPGEGGLIVRASFRFADGSEAAGCLSATAGESSLSDVQPIFVGAKGQVVFWRGMVRPTPEQLARDYEVLGKVAGDVFPIKYTSAVPLRGGPVTGEIPGFLVLEDFETMRVSTLR